MTTTALDEKRIERFAGQLLANYVGTALCYLIDIGHRTGLFEAFARGSATSQELADRAGLDERYVREWLGAMVTGGVAEYDPKTRTYNLPPEHAVSLTGGGSSNMARMAQFGTLMGKYVPDVADCFRNGGGVPYEKYRPEFTAVMDAGSRNNFDEHLISDLLPLAADLPDQLSAGARVADVGCGTGHALSLLGAAYPASTFVGYDLATDALDAARQEAAAAGLANVSFEQRDVARLGVDGEFDAVLSFDTIHDQADPRGVLASVHRALKPGGWYVMVEPCVSSNLEENVGNPMAPLVYGVSVLHCLAVSLAQGGEGLGTAFGEQRARQLLDGAGFTDVEVSPAPGDPMDAVFVARKPA